MEIMQNQTTLIITRVGIIKDPYFSSLPQSEAIALIKKLQQTPPLIYLDGNREYPTMLPLPLPNPSYGFPSVYIFTKNGVYSIGLMGENPEWDVEVQMRSEINNPEIEASAKQIRSFWEIYARSYFFL